VEEGAGDVAAVYGIGERAALGEAAKRLSLSLAGLYAATEEGFTTLRQDIASQPKGEATVLVAPRGAMDREGLVVELLRLEAAGARLIDGEGRDPLASVVDAVEDQDLRPSDRARKIRETMSRKAMRGLVLGRIPYGYQSGPNGTLQEAPTESTVVTEIFRLASEGKGIRAIVKELNAQELRTRRGGAWSMITVRDMLRNRVYTGTYDRFGSRVARNHPALVSSDTFKRIQERLDARAQKSGYAPGTPFLLSGTAVCATCGSRMIGVTRRQTWTRTDGTRASNIYRYYQCEAATNQSRCSYHTHRAPELDAEVLAKLGQDTVSSAASAALSARLAALAKDASAGRVSAEEMRRKALPLHHAAETLRHAVMNAPFSKNTQDSPFSALIEASSQEPALRTLLRDVVQRRIEKVVVGVEASEVVARK
jgi:hypothetical protein